MPHWQCLQINNIWASWCQQLQLHMNLMTIKQTHMSAQYLNTGIPLKVKTAHLYGTLCEWSVSDQVSVEWQNLWPTAGCPETCWLSLWCDGHSCMANHWPPCRHLQWSPLCTHRTFQWCRQTCWRENIMIISVALWQRQLRIGCSKWPMKLVKTDILWYFMIFYDISMVFMNASSIPNTCLSVRMPALCAEGMIEQWIWFIYPSR